MIYEVSGDILLTKAQMIAHGIASNDPMNPGLALSLHKNYPAMHKDFHHWCHVHNPKPGSAWMWGGAGGVRIANLITQESHGHGNHPGKASVKYVRKCLKELKKMVQKEKISSLALPKLATGVGGLDWKDVEPLIKDILGELEIPVYVYTMFHADQKAKEPGII